MIKLATVSPCFNEEEGLAQSVAKLTDLFQALIAEEKIAPDSMIVLVNDGSRDKTWDIISQLHRDNPLVRGINLSHNAGHQNAIMAGMMTAKNWADAVITLDADLQDNYRKCIPEMVDAFLAGHDIVYGVKVSRQADPLLKRMSAQTFYHLQKTMGVDSIFNHADFRLMSRKALLMLADYKERNLYLRGLVPLIGLPSTTVDDEISAREAGHSHYTVRKLFFLLISLGIGGYVIHSFVAHTEVAGWASIILSIWLVGAMLMMAIGVVGVYIGKIYEEVKHRPLYHISDILD